QHVLERQKTMQAEQQAAQRRQTGLQTEKQQKQDALESLRASLADLLAKREQAQTAKQGAELALNTVRNELQKAERLAQEKVFNNKIITNNINDIKSKINAIAEEKQALLIRRNEAETMLEAAKMESLKANLEAALVSKQQRET